MQKIYLILSFVFTLLSLVFSILPMDTIALLPIGLAIAFCLLTIRKSEKNKVKIPKWLLTISVLCSVFVIGKTLLIKDEVVVDQTFEQQKIETKQEAKKDLEELEQLENDLE